MAARGLRFTDAHAPASWCTPTRFGLLTGCYPFRTSLDWRNGPVLAADRLTLPSMLRQHGYRTVMVGKWHLGFELARGDRGGVHAGGPTARGFNTYFGIPASLDIPPYYYLEGDRPVAAPTGQVAASQSAGWTNIQGAFWRAGGIAPDFQHVDVLPRLTTRAVQEISTHATQSDAPLFLYLALPAPHTPWLPTKEFAGGSEVPLYGDFVRQVDDTVQQVVAALDAAGMTRNTLLLFTSDNGPVWYADDEARYGHRSTGPWRGMKGDAWEGGHRLPLLVQWPQRIHGGQVCEQLVCLTDVFATCANIVGHRIPAGAAEDSFDLTPLLADPKGASPRRELVVNSTQNFFMVRRDHWKLIPFIGSGGFSKPKHVTKIAAGEPKGQLYNLRLDPGETTNVYQQHPDIVDQLERRLTEVRLHPTARGDTHE